MPIPEYVQRLRAKIGNDLLMYPAVVGVILDEERRVLLMRRADTGGWALPGGIMEPGEEPAEAVIREVKEETGLDVAPTRIVGVYAGKENLGAYPNGDRYAIVSVAFACEVKGGTLDRSGDETLDLRFFSADDLPPDLYAPHRIRIQHGLGDDAPFFANPAYE